MNGDYAGRSTLELSLRLGQVGAAAGARDAGALELQGEFAYLNFPGNRRGSDFGHVSTVHLRKAEAFVRS